MPDYRVIGIIDASTFKESTKRGRVPKDSEVCEWAHKHGCRMAVRYFPSMKGWRLCDLRNARQVALYPGSSKGYWRGHAWSPRAYSKPEIAVMIGLHELARQGKLL